MGQPFGTASQPSGALSPQPMSPMQSPQYDPYTASRRPNYMPYGPNQQFYQPIYQPSYSQFSPMGYGQAPFGGFYMPQRMGFGQQMFQPQQFQPMLSPQPTQSQFRPIPFMNQTQIDAKAAAEAPPPPSYDPGGAKAGGKVNEEGIDSLLKK